MIVMVVAAGWLLSVTGTRVRAQEGRVHIEPRILDTNTASATNPATPRIHVNTDLVLIPVTVTDGKDRLITGLTRDRFRLWDEKVEQSISHFAMEDAPVSIGVVFDSSGSMGVRMTEARAAVTQFIKTANPEDEFSLVQFSDRAQLRQGFTDRVEEIREQLMLIESRGRTALLDAIVLSLNEMRNAKHSRKAILIISDGADNNSRYTAREVKAKLREADVQIYSIGIMDPAPSRRRTLEDMGGAALLDDIAKQTGGRLFEVDDLDQLPEIAAKIGSALRNQYVLGYPLSTEMRNGKYHRVQVKIARPKGFPSLRASFRGGYLAPTN
jgi:VWFA-related protein